MSILIKGMKMPESCFHCLLAFQDQDSEHNVYWTCAPLNEDAIGLERRPDCPLIEVPEPHGRLIDADALQTSSIIGRSMVFGGEYVYTQSAIDNSPTVIPASEVKE